LNERIYEHRFHAGNVGDVFKHCAYLALLGATKAPRAIVETHAGSGTYALGPTGEWTEGIGKLLEAKDAPPLVARYLDLVRAHGAPSRYPGSPLLALELADRIILHELVDGTRAELSRALRGDPRASVRGGDGLEALSGSVSELSGAGEVIALVDPPYADRAEWPAAAEAVIALRKSAPSTRLLLWYPVKSYARPNAMLAQLEKARIGATAIELITSPLTSKKNRLNGSGVLFVSPPEGLVEQIASLAAWLGPRLSAHDGWWTSRSVGLSW
jgi:23S rRNA (adenine2030-N6)-methyltransferase